jgi:large subunit ribosomal protein L18
MSLVTKQNNRIQRRTLRVRNRVKAYSTLPRVSVYKSLNEIYAQIIDDAAQKTVVNASSLKVKKQGDKKAVARLVGLDLARKAKEKGIEAAAFDRGPFLYHGRIKALVEGLREGGLKI